MSCGMFDDYESDPKADPLDDKARWVTIHVYSRADAINDGVLVPYQFTYKRKSYDCCFTDRLWTKHGKSAQALRWITDTGMQKLSQPDPEDTPHMQLRVILKDQIWVILGGEGLTFMTPEDY